MAASATGATATCTRVTQKTDESLPTLFSRLGDDVMQLFDTKLSLLKVELKEEANAYARGGIMIAAGGIIAAIGFALLNVALAFGISTLFANATDLSQPAKYAIGFCNRWRPLPHRGRDNHLHNEEEIGEANSFRTGRLKSLERTSNG